MEAPELLLAARLLESSPPAEQPESSPPVEKPEPLHAAELPASVPSELMEYPEWETIVDFPGWVPEIEPPTEEQQSPTHGELEVPLGQPNSSVVPKVDVKELPSAVLECLLDVEHSQAVETGRSENQFGLLTREDIEKSLWTPPRDFADLGDCASADIGGVAMGTSRGLTLAPYLMAGSDLENLDALTRYKISLINTCGCYRVFVHILCTSMSTLQ
jgi:hypothetical protein